MKVLMSILLALFAFPLLAATDPAESLAQARTQITNKQFREAATTLTSGIEAAQGIADATTRTQALAALHFYSAVAYSGLRDDTEATRHLRLYLASTPNARNIDSSKYDKRFVALFNELVQVSADSSGFDNYYPGFPSFVVKESKHAQADAFGPNPALLILGTRDEQQKFRSLIASEERVSFINEFWKRRDPTPDTPRNEFQETFVRRAEFADKSFSTNDGLGAMSDRGKVFILLGEPAYVRRRPITQKDAIHIFDDYLINGTIEQWVYTRDQMPMKMSKPRVMYRFVTQEGIGQHILQKQEDAFAMQALSVAANPDHKR